MNTDWQKLHEHVISTFKLDIGSVHGPSHWKRVEQFGVALAKENGADIEVVKLFALFHDSCRENEYDDAEHGARGAELARQLRGEWFDLTDNQFDLLHYACSWHTEGELSPNITIGTCWDADRLDLPRVGVVPDKSFLSTESAKKYLKKISQ